MSGGVSTCVWTSPASARSSSIASTTPIPLQRSPMRSAKRTVSSPRSKRPSNRVDLDHPGRPAFCHPTNAGRPFLLLHMANRFERRRASGAFFLLRLTQLKRADAVRPHHLVVFVLHDVAVPDELPGRVELRSHPRHLAWIGDHGVLEAGLPGVCRRDDAV